MMIIDERDFIKKALEEQGLNLFDFYDGHQLLSLNDFVKLPLHRRPDVLLIDTQTILSQPEKWENCLPTLNTFHGVFFFYEHSDAAAESWVNTQTSFLSKILGAIALPMPTLNWTILSNQLQFFWNMIQEQKTLQKHMTQFSQELDQVLQTAEQEMSRAKKIYEILLPKKSDDIKGVHFLNKYASGDGAGVEFYDLYQDNNKVFQVLVTSDSYLISSSLLGILGQHKKKDFNPESFLLDAQADIETINTSKKKRSDVGIMILELDLSNLYLKSFGNHKAELYSQAKGKLDLSNDPYQLSKGEKFIVFSPGFIFNWNEDHKQDIQSFLKGHQSLKCEELMTELFFQIRQDKAGQFLKKDATVVMMEVNRHGMHQV